MSYDIKDRDKFIAGGVLLFIFIILAITSGCGMSNTAKPAVDTVAREEIEKINKKQSEQETQIEGNHNEVKTFNQMFTEFKTTINKHIETVQETWQDSMKTQIAKVEGDVNNKVEKTQNSAWLVFGVVIAVVVIVVFILFFLYWIFRIVMKSLIKGTNNTFG